MGAGGFVMCEEGLRDVYERVLAGTSLVARRVEVHGCGVHVIETGDGPPLLLLHGTGSYSLFFRPLLERLGGVRAIAPDRPGQGLSDPADLDRGRYREAVVGWVDGLLDALGLSAVSLLGHSMGGLWALWYALARPGRVERLVLIGPPQLPGTRAPLPYRVMATPGLGEMLQRLQPPARKSVLQFARLVGEGETLPNYPDLVDLLVASGRDTMAARTDLAETRMIVSPFALVTRTGFRHNVRVRPDELRQLAVPTLLVWGEHEPLGGTEAAKALHDLMPRSQLELLPAGHAPWLGHPEQLAERVAAFASQPPLLAHA
jgi:pimeloyl-ACP methyl ester carboxylesterase